MNSPAASFAASRWRASCVLRPRIVVLDEPTSGLDMSVQATVLNLLLELRQRFGLTYLFISHDLSVVRALLRPRRDHVSRPHRRIGDGREIFADPRHPYTRALLAAAPTLEPETAWQTIPIAGEPPSAANLLPGCPFAPRCPYAQPACTEHEQTLQSIGNERAVACRRWSDLLASEKIPA